MSGLSLPSSTSPYRSPLYRSGNRLLKCSVTEPQRLNCDSKLYKVLVAKSCVRLKVSAELRSQVLDCTQDTSITDSSWLPPDNIQRTALLPESSSNSSNDADDFEKQLQELFNEIKTLVSRGKTKDAVYLLTANYKAVKEQLDLGCKGIEEAALLDIVALGFMTLGDMKLVDLSLRVLNDVVSNLNDAEPMLVSILIHMGSMYFTLGKLKKSSLMYQRALHITELTHGRDSTFAVTPLMGLAKVLCMSKKASEAVNQYHRVIKILEAAQGPDGVELLLPLSCLGNLLMNQGKNIEAENIFTRILSISMKSYGKRDGTVAVAICSIAHVKCAQGHAEEAIELYRKALEVMKDSGFVGLDDEIIEKMRIDLAEMLHQVGRAHEAQELLEECLLITQKYKGKEDVKMVTHLMNLATSYSQSENYVEAERALRTCLKITRKTIGPDDPALTYPLLKLAVIVYKLKRFKEAERIALDVLRIREAAFGNESLPVGEALDCLISIKIRLEEDDEKLLLLLKRVLCIQEKEFGSESEEVMVSLEKMVFFLGKLGRKDEKSTVVKRLAVLSKKFVEKRVKN